jgi:hypothetical protein
MVFKIEKQKALENTNKAVKDLISTPSFNFVLNSMGNFKRLGNLEDQTGERKRLVWLGKQPIFGLYKEGFFGPGAKPGKKTKIYARGEGKRAVKG